MVLVLEELDRSTRQHMLREFRAELVSPHPFEPRRLSARGAALWPRMMEDAITDGDDDSLIHALRSVPGVLMTQETYERAGVLRSRTVNTHQASELLAVNEFNTWYVRGLAARLLEEQVAEVEVYRAANPRWEIAACATHEGSRVATRVVYDGHRAGYWPMEDPAAFSVPFQPGCHHSIRRVID